ncbi:Nitrogen assimilation transcription factor nit-4 [Choanephora cucurbitarum]|uniref:Nitrogen assimilation transcription factor nit-4 n=1 Tax=Choanephora cucurbitarum TaxID=101091 RepID=A0A1C7NKF4_9FUNG|nr:Nitrogen assimilation transcription factor nit-4 [Choanephora cucurbitarum]
MENLLTSLTNQSIKDIERNDFRIDAFAVNRNQTPIHTQAYQEDDEEEEEEEEEDESSISDESTHSSKLNSSIEDTLANLDLDDYDTLKYTGHSAGLQLIDQKLFKSKTFVPLPGRDDVALRLMSQNELLVVRTGKKKPDTRLDVGFSLNSSIFDEKHNQLQLNSARSSSIDLPTRSIVEKAYGLYFSHIHLFLPLVNKNRFETHDSKSSNVLAQAVLAVAFRFASLHFPKLFTQKKASLYADAYFKKVISQLQDSARPRLRHVQAALLMTLYLDMAEEDVESMQWYMLGKAIRMAQDIGLHRSCSNWNLPLSEIETRHRVFYVCYVLDRLMGARAGKPLTILDRDFDTDMPMAHEVYDDGRAGPSVYHSFISLIKLSEILGRILKALYAPKSKCSNTNAGLDDPTILAVFDRRLKNWRATLDSTENGVIWSQPQKVNLLLFYHTVMLLLHRPFVEYSSTAIVVQGSVDMDKLVAESRQACENAASSISVIIRQKQTLMSDPDSYGPLCLPSCFVYAMFQSSLIHLAITIKNRDSLRRLRLLQRSMTLLKQHRQLASAQRAHNILLLLVKVNKINISNLLENDTGKEDAPYPTFEDDTISQTSPVPSCSEIQLIKSQQNQLTDGHSVSEDTMPKSSWYQRMMNTSIVGGITADLHQGVHNNPSSTQTLDQLLPYTASYQHQSNYMNYQINMPTTKKLDIFHSHQATIYGGSQPTQPSSTIATTTTTTAAAPLLESNAMRHPSMQQLLQNDDSTNYQLITNNGTNTNSTLLSHHHSHIIPRTGLTPTGYQHNFSSHSESVNTSSVPYSNTFDTHASTSSGLNWNDWSVYVNPSPSMPEPSS